VSLNLAVDVNAGDWDSSLEERPVSTGILVLRLGLRLVSGAGQGPSSNAAGPQRRAFCLGQGSRLAGRGGAAGARCHGRGRCLCQHRRQPPLGGLGRPRRGPWTKALPLFAAAPEAALVARAPLMVEPAVTLPPQSEGETAIEDYRSIGLSLGRHLLALLRPALDRLGLGDTPQLGRLRAGSWIRLPGLVLMRQRPGSAKGIGFLTIENEHEVGNLVVYP
jgi:error-prone DNA polymerase